MIHGTSTITIPVTENDVQRIDWFISGNATLALVREGFTEIERFYSNTPTILCVDMTGVTNTEFNAPSLLMIRNFLLNTKLKQVVVYYDPDFKKQRFVDLLTWVVGLSHGKVNIVQGKMPCTI